MANITVHIAIAQEWAKRHKVHNMDDFIWGAVAPDVLGKTQGSHITHYSPKFYSDDMDAKHLNERYFNRVSIDAFLDSVEVNNDYQLGYLLHLATDKYFYNEFIDVERLKSLCKTYEEVRNIVFQTYDATLKFVNKTYGVNYENLHPEMEGLYEKYGNCAVDEEPIIYKEEQLKDFISRMAELDLYQIIKNHDNLKRKEEEKC